MVYPKRVGRVVTSLLFSPIKCVKTATWSHSVNSDDFLVAEAGEVLEHVPSRSKRQPRQHLFCEATEGTRHREAI